MSSLLRIADDRSQWAADAWRNRLNFLAHLVHSSKMSKAETRRTTWCHSHGAVVNDVAWPVDERVCFYVIGNESGKALLMTACMAGVYANWNTLPPYIIIFYSLVSGKRFKCSHCKRLNKTEFRLCITLIYRLCYQNIVANSYARGHGPNRIA